MTAGGLTQTWGNQLSCQNHQIQSRSSCFITCLGGGGMSPEPPRRTLANPKKLPPPQQKKKPWMKSCRHLVSRSTAVTIRYTYTKREFGHSWNSATMRGGISSISFTITLAWQPPPHSYTCTLKIPWNTNSSDTLHNVNPEFSHNAWWHILQ